jgi:hypothetical protein
LLLSGYQLSGALCHYNKQTIYPPKLFISWRAPALMAFCTCGAKESEFNERRYAAAVCHLYHCFVRRASAGAARYSFDVNSSSSTTSFLLL